MSATNPESGTTTYNTYDNNGNLTKRTDFIGTVTNLTYDGLNRMKTRTYTVAGSTAATPSVCYGYDADYFGALSSVSTSSAGCPATAGSNTSSTAYTHDGFGRISTSSQTMGTGSPYLFSYGYSLTDQLTQMTYPSGRQVSYALDAADRVQTVQNVTGGGNYASSITYTPAGGLSSMTMGNGVTQQLTWNDRQQPLSISAKSASNTALLTLGLYPCASQATSCTSGNNGNLQSQTITMPNLSTLTQSYTFDSLNRLTNASETGGSGWTQSYGYYGNGNMYVSANTNLPPLSSETPQGASWYSASAIPNRINGWGYDLNGNVLQIANTSRSFTYDAENRQVTATINSAGSSYLYDGLGQRVSKTVGGQTTTLVYDAFGELAAEYGSPEASQCGTATCYVMQDHLGSTRLLTDSTGSSNVRRYDYLPFGGELLAGIDGRTNGLGYQTTPDDVDPKFTGKNRDPETGLDWFEVRYLSGAQGRFQSVDPGNAGAALGDPQTWNGYAYAGNNPVSYADPSGEGFFDILAGVFAGFVDFFATGNVSSSIQVGEAVAGFAETIDSLAHGQPPGGDLFGFGSSSGVRGLLGCGGPLGDCSSTDPWGEDAGLTRVQDPGRFITDWQSQSASSLSPISQFGTDPLGVSLWAVGTFSSGAADFLTLNATKRINQWDGGASAIGYNSGIYTAGKVAGVGIVVTGALAPIAADIGEVQAGRLFGTKFAGNRPLLNSNDTLRIGWSYIRSTGQYVFRIGGTAVGAIKANPHINLWPPSWWLK